MRIKPIIKTFLRCMCVAIGLGLAEPVQASPAGDARALLELQAALGDEGHAQTIHAAEIRQITFEADEAAVFGLICSETPGMQLLEDGEPCIHKPVTSLSSGSQRSRGSPH